MTMKTLSKKIEAALKIENEEDRGKALAALFRDAGDDFLLPGQNKDFDIAYMEATKYMKLSPSDESILDRVTNRMLASEAILQKAVVKLKDLATQAQDAAMAAWQDAVMAMQWQMVPVPVTRSVSTPDSFSLGTIEKGMDKTRVKLNIGWNAQKDLLKLLVQVQDEERNGVSGVEVRLKEIERGTILSFHTDEDGTMQNNAIKIEDGQYQVQVLCDDQIVETPIFKV